VGFPLGGIALIVWQICLRKLVCHIRAKTPWSELVAMAVSRHWTDRLASQGVPSLPPLTPARRPWRRSARPKPIPAPWHKMYARRIATPVLVILGVLCMLTLVGMTMDVFRSSGGGGLSEFMKRSLPLLFIAWLPLLFIGLMMLSLVNHQPRVVLPLSAVHIVLTSLLAPAFLLFLKPEGPTQYLPYALYAILAGGGCVLFVRAHIRVIRACPEFVPECDRCDAQGWDAGQVVDPLNIRRYAAPWRLIPTDTQVRSVPRARSNRNGRE